MLDDGARVAGVKFDLISASPDADLSKEERAPVFIDLGHLDPASITRSIASAEGGRFALANYRHALAMGRDGRADAVCFTPFNKNAMRLAHPVCDDEIGFSADVVGLDGPASEFKVLDGLWNARATSHIPLAEVASHITGERVLRALRLTDASMRTAGFKRSRIAVAGLNPHAGDGGNFGRPRGSRLRKGAASGH